MGNVRLKYQDFSDINFEPIALMRPRTLQECPTALFQYDMPPANPFSPNTGTREVFCKMQLTIVYCENVTLVH